MNKNEINCLIKEKQTKFEQVLLDSLNSEQEILYRIYQFFVATKNIAPSLSNLISLTKNGEYGDLWLNCLEAERFFCTRTCLLKDKILEYFGINTISFVQIVETILESSSSKSFVSIFYFNTIFDLLKEIAQMVRSGALNSEFIDNLFINFDKENDNLFFLRDAFTQKIDQMIIDETNFKSNY